MATDRKIIANTSIASEIANKTSASAAFLYLMIASQRDEKTGECCITAEALAKITGMSDKTIKRQIVILREAGFLDWKQGGTSNIRANNYILLKETLNTKENEYKEKEVPVPPKYSNILSLPPTYRPKSKKELEQENECKKVEQESMLLISLLREHRETGVMPIQLIKILKDYKEKGE